ncbi:MAG: hypothetical protein P5680_23275 [Limnospira sp. PMC 737.11]|uniref:hypothetical protein n=1 Tax=unclassified Limnospira TaxID=2642885 RepID=UPI0028E0E78E|nr:MULTISPECIES: hypothetical protein [unclassified Limnospira]MDT9267279.1 hypothetical protein [Limnospira sp. PMC 1223.20]MDT9277466.1 hypothetical protein [Limnospira sp. PMC 737.11]
MSDPESKKAAPGGAADAGSIMTLLSCIFAGIASVNIALGAGYALGALLAEVWK